MLVPAGVRKDLQRAAMAGLYQPVWSPWIIQETWRVLAWRWAQRRAITDAERRQMGRAANAMFFHLDAICELATPKPPFTEAWPTLSDPFDAPVYAAAVSAGCSVVVSNNTKHFPPGPTHEWRGARYVKGVDFLAEIGWT